MCVTLYDTYILAKKLKEKSSKIQAVELFGSVLKNGSGHDVDFILIVDDKLAKEFWLDTFNCNVRWPQWLYFIRKFNRIFFPNFDKEFSQKRRIQRQKWASNLIGVDLTMFGEEYRPSTTLDVWLMPDKWHIGKVLNKSVIASIISDRNTLAFFSSVSKFIQKIA